MVLLDLRLPNVCGLSSLVYIRGEYPDVPVAMISGGAFQETIARARALGAAAFIPKSASVATIATALSQVAEGGIWFREVESSSESGSRAGGNLDSLSRQQYRVLNYLVEGVLNKQIAEKLNISEGTVRAHVTAILRKLQVNTRTQAVILVNESHVERDGAGAT
jgi:DNA-binding NarL/FixJ family response regulator